MVTGRSSVSDVALGFGTATDRRAAVEREEQERAAERVKQLASQVSPMNDPQERIRIWEKLHALSLPRAASHKLVRVIAAQTDLTIQQVQQEQQRRAMPASALPGVSA